MKLFRNISFFLLGFIAFLLAIATFIEPFKGTEFVCQYLYNSVFFVVLWGAVAVTSLTYIIKKRGFCQIHTFLIHIAFLVVLLGAFTTWKWGQEGSLHLREGESVGKCVDSNGNTINLPFVVTLEHFRISTYFGTQTPKDFISEITVVDKEKPMVKIVADVSMNNVFSYKGFRLYQTNYDTDVKGTRFTFSYDVYGVAITYFGYFLLFFSLLFFFFGKHSEFRKLLRSQILKKTIVLSLVIVFSIGRIEANESKIPIVLSQEIASNFCDLYVLHNGRICPLQTLAIDFTVKLYGKPCYKSYTAEQVFCGFLFSYSDWVKEKMIKIKGSILKKNLGIEGQYAAVEDFFDRRGQYKLRSMLEDIYKDKEVPDKKLLQETDEKIKIILMIYAGKLVRIFPVMKRNMDLQWYATNGEIPQDISVKKKIFVRKTIDYIRELLRAGKSEELQSFIKKIKRYQENEIGTIASSLAKKCKAEKYYNAIDFLRYLFPVFFALGVFGFIYFVRGMIVKIPPLRSVIVLFNIFSVLGLFYLTIFLSLRGYISGHFPATNGYETMQFLACISLVFTLFLQSKYRLFLSFGLLLTGLTLLVSSLGKSSPQITQLIPVLSSPLLSIHVAVIMISYLLLGFIMLNGATALLLYFIYNKKYEAKILQVISQLMLYPAVFLLVIGTFLGAIWANTSWGRYWGWDPKEVWALITFIVYSFPLHSQSIEKFKQPVFFHIYGMIAFFSVLFTYFGVNFILGGMHSYAAN